MAGQPFIFYCQLSQGPHAIYCKCLVYSATRVIPPPSEYLCSLKQAHEMGGGGVAAKCGLFHDINFRS